MTRKQKSQIAQGAYQDGIDDYCAGVPLDLCPYERRQYRAAWCKGWRSVDREVTAAMSADQCDLFVPRMISVDAEQRIGY